MDKQQTRINSFHMKKPSQNLNTSFNQITSQSYHNAESIMNTSFKSNQTSTTNAQSKIQIGMGLRPNSKGRDNSLNTMTNSSLLNTSQTGLKSELMKIPILNLNQDEQAFAGQLKVDLIQLQDEIKDLDPDGQLHNSPNSDYNKPHINVMKKWLSSRTNQEIQQDIETRMGQSIEIERLIESLNVKNSDQAAQKLYRVLNIFDAFINKLTEYEVLVYLRYDETINSLISQYGSNISSSQKSTLLGSGMNINRFQICFANLERFLELISVAQKLSDQKEQKSQNSSPLKSINPGNINTNNTLNSQLNLSNVKSKEDLFQILKSDSSSQELRLLLVKLFDSNSAVVPPNNENQDLKDKLNYFEKENSQLQQKIELLNLELKSQQNEGNQILSSRSGTLTEVSSSSSLILPQETFQNYVFNSPPPKYAQDPTYWTSLIDQVKQNYRQKFEEYEQDIQKLREINLDKNIKYQKLEQEMKFLKEQINEVKLIKSEIFQKFQGNDIKQQQFQQTYEMALQQEFERMKNSFEQRINILNTELDKIKRQKGKLFIELQKQYDREKDTSFILSKKLKVYVQ